jgi:hypothetical protein
MKPKARYQIERPAPGVIAYREGNKEHLFPVFEQDGETIFVEWPTRQRIFLALVTWAWTRIPKEFSKADRERITPRVVEHLRNEGTPVRVMAPSSGDEAGLEFRPELFECRSRAIEVLEAAGIVWLSDYSSVDLLHEEYGLEVCGIAQESSVDRVAEAMRTGFPHWHYRGLCHKEGGRDPGWRFGIHMFPRCGGGRCAGAE